MTTGEGGRGTGQINGKIKYAGEKRILKKLKIVP
jgi:hypothetical protein